VTEEDTRHSRRSISALRSA